MNQFQVWGISKKRGARNIYEFGRFFACDSKEEVIKRLEEVLSELAHLKLFYVTEIDFKSMKIMILRLWKAQRILR